MLFSSSLIYSFLTPFSDPKYLLSFPSAMEFFLEMLFTAVVSLLFSFLVSKLVSVAMAGNCGGVENDPTSDQAEISVGDDFVTEELRFGLKMDAQVLENQRNLRVFDENVEPVDRFRSEADGIEEEVVVLTAEAGSTAAVSPEMVVRGEDEGIGSAEEINVGTTAETVSTASASPENVVAEEIKIRGQEEGISGCVENKGSGDVAVVVSESEEVKVEEEKEELSIEEDDWEGIERSELEKAFAAAANFLEESGKAEEIGAEAKMDLYGLHKIATEGSCREAQPMALMLSARAKWNAWQKLGNMNQEEAMEQYLALLSKEFPSWMNTGHTVGKMPEMVTPVVLHPNSGSFEDPPKMKSYQGKGNSSV